MYPINQMLIRATKIEFDSNIDGIFDELAALLDPEQNMMVTYKNGHYIVEFDAEQLIDGELFEKTELFKAIKFIS
jgi:hypothetical protein